MLKILVDLIPKLSSFSVLQMATITKWRNTKDWIDTENYPHHKMIYSKTLRIRTWIFYFSLNRFLYKWYLKQI